MKIIRSVVLALACASAALACGGSVEAGPQSSASAVTKAPVAESAHGVVKELGAALGEVSLRPDQRAAIEKLAGEAEARHAPLAAQWKELVLAAADQVEAGKVDEAALQPKLDALKAAGEKVRAEDRAAFVRLHDLLDAEQRNAFVDAVEKRMHDRGSEHHQGFAKMKEWNDELKLTDAQRTQLREAFHHAKKPMLHERHAGKGKHHPLEAFRADTYQPEATPPPSEERFAHVKDAAEKIVPILTPEQRKIAADKLRTLANQEPIAP